MNNNRVKSSRRSEAGTSLMETLVMVGILGLVAYFVVGLLKTGTIGQKTLQAQDDSRTVTENIAAVLSDPTACANTFSVVTPAILPSAGAWYWETGSTPPATTSPDPSFSQNNFVIKDAAGGAAYTLGKVYGNRSLHLKGIAIGGPGKDARTGIDRWTPLGGPPPTSGTMYVDVIWSQTGTGNNTGGPKEIHRFFVVNTTQLNATTGAVSACVAMVGGGGSSYWSLNSATGNIYNNNNNGTGFVGIGTQMPTGLLDVYANSTHSILVDSSGKVGIGLVGAATPGAGFNLASTNQWGAWSQADFRLGDATDHLNIGVATGGAGEGDVRIYAAGARTNRMIFGTGTTQNDVFVIQNGSVGIKTSLLATLDPAIPLEVAGDVKATSFISTSDERLKTDIHPVEGLAKVLGLRGVRFRWRESGAAAVGLIAQEVEKVFPELVVTDKSTGYKAIRYGSLVAPLIEAVKELNGMAREALDLGNANSRRIAALEAGNTAKDAEIRELSRRLDEQARELGALKAKAGDR